MPAFGLISLRNTVIQFQQNENSKNFIPDSKLNGVVALCYQQSATTSSDLESEPLPLGKQHQISCGDNYDKSYLLTLFDQISITSSSTSNMLKIIRLLKDKKRIKNM